MNLAGKKAFVTGAARGIGKGCALALARRGAEVCINDREANATSAAALEELRQLGQPAHLAVGDVFSRTSGEQVVRDALKKLGRIDIFVSNPAFSRRALFLEFDPTTFENVLQGTLTSGFHMSQLVARHMVERGGGGKIVFISSIHARIPFAKSVAYNAGKYGLMGLAFTVANELMPHRINVNVIEPGWIDTPGEHEAFGSDTMAKAGPTLPWGRLGTPDDIGKAVAFLASEDADYITGATLVVDGGLWMRGADE